MPVIERTTTRVTGDTAVNVANRFWLLRDEDDGVDVHAVDESNTVDDITLGERVDYCTDAAQAIVLVGGFVVLDDAARAAILSALTAR